MLYIYLEDDKNSVFHQLLNLFKKNNVSKKLSNCSIRCFEGNLNLYDYLTDTDDYGRRKFKVHKEHKYLVFFDNVKDKGKIKTMYDDLCKTYANYSNVYVSDVLCFEYILLKFSCLTKWSCSKTINKFYLSQYNNLCYLRKEFIDCIDNNKDWKLNNNLYTYALSVYNKAFNKISSEDIACVLLMEITNKRNKLNFFVNKTFIGNCWYCDCCMNKYKGIDNCQLYNTGYKQQDKLVCIWENTVLKEIIESKG